METLKRNPLLCIMALVGLVCSLVLLFGRVQAEQQSNQVACAISILDRSEEHTSELQSPWN